MTELLPATAIVLAGGRSSRFGADKLTVEVDGEPLLHRSIRAVAQVCDEIIVVGSPAGLSMGLPADLPTHPVVLLDDDPYPGPLVAFARSVAMATRELLLLVAGDMPRMEPAILRRVLSWTAGRDGTCLIAGGIDRPFPMGLSREAAAHRAERLVEREARSLRALIDSLDLERVTEDEWRRLDPEARSLQDIDRPEDLS